MANQEYVFQKIDFEQNPELLTANPKKLEWCEFVSAPVNGTRVQGYVVPTEDTTPDRSKTYYNAPTKA